MSTKKRTATKKVVKNPDSRQEQYLTNILSVMSGEEVLWDPGIPQSREEEYLTAILESLQTKGSGASLTGNNIFHGVNTFQGNVVIDNGATITFVTSGLVTSKNPILDYQGITFTKPDGSTAYVWWDAIPNMNVENYNHFPNLTIAKTLTIPDGGIPNYATIKNLETKIPNPPSTNGTYVYKATRTASGVTFEWVLE